MYFEDLIATQDLSSIPDFKELNKDKYYVKQLIKIPGRKKKQKREYFGSGMTGSQIRNAITGFSTGYIVGTNDEDRFFKVAFATGLGSSNTITLFYDSPESYEKHTNSNLTIEIKNRLSQKQQGVF